MIVQQFVHQLNNSELGRTGVHESYVSVPRGLVPDLKFVTEGKINATFKRTGSSYSLKFKKYDNGEFRLTGLGELYRESGASAGDLIILEDAGGTFWVDFVYRKRLVVFGAQGKGRFECRNEERLAPFLNVSIPCHMDGALVDLKIIQKGTIQPRSDSARTVNVFELNADGRPIVCGRNQALNFFTLGGGHFLVPSPPDAIRKIEWSDYD